MFTGQRQPEKGGGKKVVVGYDLGEIVSQISFCSVEGGEAETVSAVAGTEQYNIPTVLCKRIGVNQWFYGKEALKYAKKEEGILVENLLTFAQRGEDVIVEGESFDPAALLTLFVKRSLSLLGMYISLDQVEAYMFTVENLNPRVVDVLSRVAGGLGLPAGHVFFQSHVESFYYYMLYQPRELWKNDVLILDYNAALHSVCMECNRKTTPQVVFINSREYRQIQRVIWSEKEDKRQEQKKDLESRFAEVVAQELAGNEVSTVFLLGDGFKENWMGESLKTLCRNRRVFQGNNLYSKGACSGALEKEEPSREGRNYVYLGQDKLKANVGMKVFRRGEESYFAILDGGVNWYEAAVDFEVILETGNQLEFIVTPLTGEGASGRSIRLEGLPERPKNTSRLKIHVEMSACDQVTVTVEDMGFGEIFPSSGKGWTQTIVV